MRIQNNITAMNTHRMYSGNNNAVSKSSEKLSSGYRINRAGDDAAGLAISEKMRAQIRGLNRASSNSQDAISLIQTAEGAMTEVHSMLQRMNELAVQSATGTNENFDRSQISAEFNQLKNEIDDIAGQTTFNDMNLLDGSLAGTASKAVVASTKSGLNVNGQIGTGTEIFTVTGQTGLSAQKGEYRITADSGSEKIKVAFTDSATGDVTNTEIDLTKVTSGDYKSGGAFKVDLSAAGMGVYEMTAGNAATMTDKKALAAALAGSNNANSGTNPSVTTVSSMKATGTYTEPADVTAADGEMAIDYSVDGDKLNKALADANLAAGDYSFTVTHNTTDGKYSFDAVDSDGNKHSLGSVAVPTLPQTIGTAATPGSTFSVAGFSAALAGPTDNDSTEDAAAIAAKLKTAAEGLSKATLKSNDNTGSGGLKIQIGTREGDQLEIAIDAMNSKALGLDSVSIADQEGAGNAITAVRTAVNTVSEQRATLGAMQNRMEHKISNLDNTAENLSSAESRIRDVDMAKEMTEYTKNNILSQAATAMLAQANSAPQGVLSLLQ